METWEEVCSDSDYCTQRLEVSGGYLYRDIVERSGVFVTAMCFVPNSTTVIEDGLEMVSSSLETVAEKLHGVGVELYHHKK